MAYQSGQTRNNSVHNAFLYASRDTIFMLLTVLLNAAYVLSQYLYPIFIPV
jgi:hypothetical protein